MRRAVFKATVFLFLCTCTVRGQEPDDYERNYERVATEFAKKQESAEKLFRLSNTITGLAATKNEKEQSWEKLITELETEEHGKQIKILFLRDIVLGAMEPFRGKAWFKIKQLGLTTDFDTCDVFKFVVLNVPEPYKEYAWNELGKCGLDDFNKMYSSLVIGSIVPYSLWAWQNLESFWSLNGNRNQKETKETLLSVVLYAGEPYQQWAWDKISANQPDITILYKLLTEWPHPEPYAAMSWAIISTLKFGKITKQEINILKTIANHSSRMIYRLAALEKLLSAGCLSSEEVDSVAKMSAEFAFALDQQSRHGGYAINYPLLEIKKENENQ